MEPISEHREHFEGSKAVDSHDGWITPAGVFYGCNPEQHDQLAKFLLQNNKSNIEHRLREDNNHAMLSNLDNLPPRVVVKAAGYALLSHNLLAEQNLPKTLTLRQLELMKRNNLTFMPESGRLQTDIYLEVRKLLKDNPKTSEIADSQTYSYDHRQNFKSFVENPSEVIGIYDDESLADEVYDLLTIGNTAEIKMRRDRDIVTWRKVQLPSGNEVFVQQDRHEHSGNSNYALYEDAISLVSKHDIKKFTDKILSTQGSHAYFEGDPEMLEDLGIST